MITMCLCDIPSKSDIEVTSLEEKVEHLPEQFGQ